MHRRQVEQLWLKLSADKKNLDDATREAREIGQAEALGLGYVELIQCVLELRNRLGLSGPIPACYDIYDNFRPKGDDIPVPKSKTILDTLDKLIELGTMNYESKKEQFLALWTRGFEEVITEADNFFVNYSIITQFVPVIPSRQQ